MLVATAGMSDSTGGWRCAPHRGSVPQRREKRWYRYERIAVGSYSSMPLLRQERGFMKTRRTTNGTAARITDSGVRGIGASIVSPRITHDETTEYRMGPEQGPSLQRAALSHERIAERARAIWQERGCLPDHDQKNWRDAESQLKTELGIG